MDVAGWLKMYDTPESIVLLCGNDEIHEEDEELVVALGQLLGYASKYVRFRVHTESMIGSLFALGLREFAMERTELITFGKEGCDENRYRDFSLGDITEQKSVAFQHLAPFVGKERIQSFYEGSFENTTPRTERLIYEMMLFTGTNECEPATFAFIYDYELSNARGNAPFYHQFCERNGIPYIDQYSWFKWIYPY